MLRNFGHKEKQATLYLCVSVTLVRPVNLADQAKALEGKDVRRNAMN